MELHVKPGISFEMLKVFETVPSLYLILSHQLIILNASDLYLNATNKNRNSIVGQNVFDIFPVDENIPGSYAIKASLEVVLKSKLPHQLPISRYDIPDPERPGFTIEKYWHSLNTPVLDEQGNILYIIHSTRDSTAQVLAEKELLVSLEQQTAQALKAAQLGRRLEHLFAELPARIAILAGPDFIYEFINPVYHQHFGDRNLIGKPLIEALPELSGHPIYEILQEVYRTGISYEGKEVCVPLVNEKGMPPVNRYFNIMYQARFDENGIINGILSFSYDITELVKSRQEVETQKQELLGILGELEDRVAIRTRQLELAQKEAEAQRDRLSRFFMQSPAGICVLDGPELVFGLVNPPYQELFPGRDLIGKPVLEALPELKGQPVASIMREVYQTGKTFEGTGLHVPLARTKEGPLEDRFFNFIYQARYTLDDEIDGLLVFVFEVTNMVRAEQRLDENQQRLNFLLNAMPQQVWTAKPDGKLDYVNKVVCDDFGKDEAYLIGHGWQDFVHPDDLQISLSEWQKSLDTSTVYAVEFRLRMNDGSYKWFLGRALPLIEDGEVKLWMGTNTNIDHQKNMEHKKDEFLSIASHELKTPLTSIKAFNQLMLRTRELEQLQKYSRKSADSILRLDKIIVDLLDVTKINAGKMLYNMQFFRFDEMLTDTVEHIQHTTLSHHISLEINHTADLYGDRIRLEQVVSNFLTNAIKYSPSADKILVRSIVQNNEVTVSVKDFGIGIAEHDKTRLFERYFRVDHTAMRFEGLGLGLFISSEILKRHHGTFWIESEQGKGSVFYFKLPLSSS